MQTMGSPFVRAFLWKGCRLERTSWLSQWSAASEGIIHRALATPDHCDTSICNNVAVVGHSSGRSQRRQVRVLGYHRATDPAQRPYVAYRLWHPEEDRMADCSRFRTILRFGPVRSDV